MKICMYNPKTKVTIQTIHKFVPQWTNLGFIQMNNVILFDVA